MKERFLLKTMSVFLVMATLLQSIPYDFLLEGKTDFNTIVFDKDLESQKDSENEKKNQSELEDTKEKKHMNRWNIALAPFSQKKKKIKEQLSFDSMVIEIISPPPEKVV